jgi:DNA-directed RNA polymerase beta' subunit
MLTINISLRDIIVWDDSSGSTADIPMYCWQPRRESPQFSTRCLPCEVHGSISLATPTYHIPFFHFAYSYLPTTILSCSPLPDNVFVIVYSSFSLADTCVWQSKISIHQLMASHDSKQHELLVTKIFILIWLFYSRWCHVIIWIPIPYTHSNNYEYINILMYWPSVNGTKKPCIAFDTGEIYIRTP